VILFGRKNEKTERYDGIEIITELLRFAGLKADDIVPVFENRDKTRGDDLRETRMLLSEARQAKALNGENKLLAIIRGPLKGKAEKDDELRKLLARQELPLVIVGPEKGIYSFAQALSAAIAAKLAGERGESIDWLIMLPSISNPAENIKALYKEYRHALERLRSA